METTIIGIKAFGSAFIASAVVYMAAMEPYLLLSGTLGAVTLKGVISGLKGK